jgi:cystathionine beta-synthase
MEKFKNTNIISAIGNTPIIRLNKVASHLKANIYVKLEFMNPAGSIKDRMGVYMCQKAMIEGKIKPGSVIVECTSGNTGAGVALFAAVNNCQAVFVMADKQSQEKINNLRAFGAKVVICPTNVEPEDPRSYYSVAAKLSKLPGAVFLNQYDNMYNTECHYTQTGPEIYKQTEGKFDVFVAGVGTGGTISGTGKYLKERMPHLKVVGVDPDGSILNHYHKTGEMIPARGYVLEGVGEDFLPKNIDFKVIDEFVTIYDEESFQMTRRLLKEEGIYCGGSCGAAVVGAMRYAQNHPEAKDILVILPDSGNRYASKIYNDAWMEKMSYKVDRKLDALDDQIKKMCSENGVNYEK